MSLKDYLINFLVMSLSLVGRLTVLMKQVREHFSILYFLTELLYDR